MSGDKKKNPDLNRAREALSELGKAREYEPGEKLEEIKADREIDVTGEVCPYPVIAAQKELLKMKPGEILVEETDHTISTHTVPDAVKEKKLAETLGVTEPSPGLYRIYLRRS